MKTEEKVQHILARIANNQEIVPDVELSPKATEIVNTIIDLIEQTKEGIKNVFTENEAFLMCDANNSVMATPSLDFKSQLSLSLEDSIDIDKLDVKWDVDKTVLLGKISGLSTAQACTVLRMCKEYWDEPKRERIRDIFSVKN